MHWANIGNDPQHHNHCEPNDPLQGLYLWLSVEITRNATPRNALERDTICTKNQQVTYYAQANDERSHLQVDSCPAPIIPLQSVTESFPDQSHDQPG